MSADTILFLFGCILLFIAALIGAIISMLHTLALQTKEIDEEKNYSELLRRK